MNIQEKSETSTSLSDKKGKNLISAVLLISLFGELILFPLMGNFDIVRLILTLAMVFFVYEGYNWARILMGVLLGLAGILVSIPLLSLEHNFSGFLVLAVIMGVYYFVGMSILLFSKSAIGFLKHRRERKKQRHHC